VASERIARDLCKPVKELFAWCHGNEGLGEAGGGLKRMRVGAADQRLVVRRDIGCESASTRQHARSRSSGP
jgi:hypothetical protein